MLHNPAMRGYYALRPAQVDRAAGPGRRITAAWMKAAMMWLGRLPGPAAPAYITKEEYEANTARMAAKQQTAASRARRRAGSACCQGTCA